MQNNKHTLTVNVQKDLVLELQRNHGFDAERITEEILDCVRAEVFASVEEILGVNNEQEA